MSGRVEQELRRLIGNGPGLAKCRTETDAAKLRAKDRFGALVKELGLSHREAARRLGLDESSVRQWCDERDLRHTPPMWALERLADALGSGVHEAIAYSYAKSETG